jgi:dolichol kinase
MNNPAGSKYISLKGEIMRKATHLFAFIIPGVYYFFNLSKSEFVSIMIPMALIMIFIDISRLRNWKIFTLFKWFMTPMMRKSEKYGSDFSGAFYILTTAALAAVFYSRDIFFAAMCFIIFGDPFSAIIGRFWGKHRFKNRSLEGSLAFFAAAGIFAIFAPGLPLSVSISGALVATVTEAVSFKVDDNVTVPLVSGLYMTLMLKILGYV